MNINQKFKTISSIPKDCNEYLILKKYIDLEKYLFSQISKQNQEKICENIFSIIKQNSENDFILKYLLELLMHFIVICPKQKEIPCYFITKLLSNISNKRDLILKILGKPSNYQYNNHILILFISQEFITIEPCLEYYEKYKDTIFSLYDKTSLEYILKEDDLINLKDFINSKGELLETIENTFYSPLNEVLILKNKRVSYQYIKINILDFCSFYGSFECFKFLKINGLDYGEYIREMSISGGNFNIIHDVEQSGILFDNCLEVSVKYHHKAIIEWLLSNYKCEPLSLAKCLEYLDYETFLFLLLNEFDINEGNITPLIYLSKNWNVNLELVQFLIDKGADINKEFIETGMTYHGISIEDTYTPLSLLCKQEEMDIETINFFLDKGADINKGSFPPLFSAISNNLNPSVITFLIDKGAKINHEYKKQGIFYRALGQLCLSLKINLETLTILIDRGADINEEFEYEYKYFTPLGYCCKREQIEAMKLLLDRGADVNKEIYIINREDMSVYTPLAYLCKKKDINIQAIKLLLDYNPDMNEGEITPLYYLCSKEIINIEAIQLLIDKGADINKGDLTPLCCLCDNENVNLDAIKLLLENGADVDKRESVGNCTALMYLCQQKNVNIEAIKLLIDFGADINKECKSANGSTFTPLFYLYKNDFNINFEAIILLIEKGANVDKEYFYYWRKNYQKINEIYETTSTILGYLCKQNEINYKLAQLLIDKGADINKECKAIKITINPDGSKTIKSEEMYKPIDFLSKNYIK